MGLLVLLAVLSFLYLFIHRLLAKQSTVYPPGPKPLPVLGNVLNLTPRELWVRATEWYRDYGEIVYVHLLGQGLVFLNTHQVAVDLLDKRGSIYSDKPPLVMAGELCGCENMVAFTRYGDKARRQRKLFTQALGATAVKTYHPLLEIQSHSLVRDIVRDPKNYQRYIRQYAGGLTLLVVYGYRVQGKDDEYLQLAEECVDILSNKIASGGGIWPVDIIPALKHLPLWFPGASFKRKAMQWSAKMQEFVDKPYETLLQSMTDGTAVPCFCTTLLDNNSDKQQDEETKRQRDFDIRWTANSMYSASLDTTVTAVLHFMLSMIQNPKVLRKAQDELDSIIGSSRLPTLNDRSSLPYLECVMSEVLRIGVAVPLGLPHRLMEDDVYKGMYIPKGSLVFANCWNMLRNEEIYPDAHSFIPERYMVEADEVTIKRRDPRNYVFGFGRRKCPGSHLIESSLWIVIATFIATVDIQKAKDVEGNYVEPKVEFENAVFRIPSSFECDIQPRSEQASKLVRQTGENH
ncbi:cytochrome P450 family protein [Abortiporus biennis]